MVPIREVIKIGGLVQIAEKKNYDNGIITKGVVKKILTSRPEHPRGIKVMLTTGVVGRVQALGDNPIVPINSTSDNLPKTPNIANLPNIEDLI